MFRDSRPPRASAATPCLIPRTSPPEPNFFLVGAAKAGTTSLYHYLSQHPQVFMSPIKEPHFLADEVRKENFDDELQPKLEQWEQAFATYLQGPVSDRFSSGPVSRWEDYLQLFQCAQDRPAIGEASPCYLWSKTAPVNIAARFPDAKIIMVLRNPIERAFAQHLHTLTFAGRPLSFREHVDMALRSTRHRIGELYPFLEFGFYNQQLQRYYTQFPRDRIRIFLYEEYLSDPHALFRGIFRFLGVDETFTPNLSVRYMESRIPRSFALNRVLRGSGLWHSAKHWVPPGLRRALRPALFRPRNTLQLNSSDRRFLADFYRADIIALSALIERDLSAWLEV
jgi:hypothetical protein